MSVYAEVKYKIATECNIPMNVIHSGTPFMNNRKFSFFDCVNVLSDLEHRFNVKLPESDYAKYGTVGQLTRHIVKKVKRHAK